VFAPNTAATTTVRRVRFRSTMCVPPCEAGVKPMPPKPASRPECMSTSATRKAESRTCTTAEAESQIDATITARKDSDAASLHWLSSSEEARAKIQHLLVTGDNRLKQGVAVEKVRETYEQALTVAREAGLEESVRPLVEVRLADLQRLAGGSTPPEPPAA
jgi:hypothetical protein